MHFVLTPFKAQGFVEHFTDKCGGVISWINQAAPSLAFSEGWGLYAEMLIAEDTDSYQDQLWQRYGALKWRVGLLIITIIIIQVSYDHRIINAIYAITYGSLKNSGFQRGLTFEPATSRLRCNTLTNLAMTPLTLGVGHLWVLMSPNGCEMIHEIFHILN